MTQDLTDWPKTGTDAVRWLAEELRQRDPNVALPRYVSEIVMAAETARENERIIPAMAERAAWGLNHGVPGPHRTSPAENSQACR